MKLPFNMPSLDPRREMITPTPIFSPTPGSYGPTASGGSVVQPKPPGLLTRIGTSIQNRLAPEPPPEMASLLDPQSIKDARRGAILQLGATLLQGSGWSNTPVTLGQALGQGLQDAQQGYRQQIGQLANQAVQRQNAEYLGEQRMAIADERNANAAAKRGELARVTALMAKRPTLYAGKFAGWSGKSREEQQQILLDVYNVAVQNNDKEVADDIKGMISSGNVIASAEKAPNMRTVTTEEGVFAFDPATGKPGQRIGDRPRPAERPISINAGQPSTYERGVIGREAATIKKEVGGFRQFADLARSATALNQKTDQELTGVDGIAVLYNFIRGMDPNAVKEGELKLAISADPTLDRFVQAAQGGQLLRGVKLSAGSIRNMLNVITRNVQSRAETTRNNIAGPVARISEIRPDYIQPSDTSLVDYTPAAPGAVPLGGQRATAQGLFGPRAIPGATPSIAPPPGVKPFVRRTP